MKVLFDELSVCVDCTMFLANGEVFDGAGNDITDEHVARMRAEWPNPDHLRHMVNACREDCEGWFSYSECEGCGSDLGGERHPAAVLGEES